MKHIMKKAAAIVLAIALTVTLLPGFGVSKAAQNNVPEGFVYADGTRFMLDGSTYYYGGTNCYYLTYKSKTEVNNVIEDAADMGLKVIRIWGHLDAGVKTGQVTEDGYPVFTNNMETTGHKDGVYFQYFDREKGRPVVNQGTDGLERLDYVISKAEQEGVKLLITFTNYWEAFGGMGQYVKWAQEAGITGLSNDDFYTNETLKGWYKDYIKTLLNRTNVYTGRQYKDEPAVFAWELANEPRCISDPGCKNDIVYNWAKEMSGYVKSIDPNHMVSVGDEGFYNYTYGSVKESSNSYVWYGANGTDFEKLMTIGTIDFGTPHIYVDQWGLEFKGNKTDDLLWFKKHAETCNANNKPVILEEFGIKDKSIRDSEYTQWYRLLEGNMYEGIEYAGTNYWMIASYLDTGRLYEDYDGYTVYGPADAQLTASTRDIIVDHCNYMNKKNISNTVTVSDTDFDRSSPADILAHAFIKLGNVSGLTCNGLAMTNGTDYTISGNQITIKSTFLSSLNLATYTFKVLTTDGNKPSFTINVYDRSIPDPELSLYTLNIDQNPKICKDESVAINKNGSQFLGIRNGASLLKEGTDYSITDNTVVLKKAFLQSLQSNATVTLVFDFYEGIDRELVIHVTDTTGQDEFDSFESYDSADGLYSAYKTNPGGSKVDLGLVSKNGSKALAYGYHIDNPSYCGVDKSIKNGNFQSFQGIELWLEGDGSGNTITIQLKDSNENYWESYITLDYTGGKTIRLPFGDFIPPSWQSAGSTINTASINQFSIYAGGNTSIKNGTVYFDNIIAYHNGPVVHTPYIQNPYKEYDSRTGSDIITDVMFYGTALQSVTFNGSRLTQGSDYAVNGGQVKINSQFLKTLKDGTHKLTYTFSDNTAAELIITVTTAQEGGNTIVIDSFDQLNSSEYTRNSNGNQITIAGSDGTAKISYSVGNPDYAGFTRTFSKPMDWSSGNKISCILYGDGSGRTLVIQFRDGAGNYFEARREIGTGRDIVSIGLDEFRTPSWASPAAASLSSITEYSVYIEKGSASSGTGTICMDNLVLGGQNQEPETAVKVENLAITTVTGNMAVFTWNSVSNAKEYDIYLNGVKIGSTTVTAFAVNQLSPGTNYQIEVLPVLTTTAPTEKAALYISTPQN